MCSAELGRSPVSSSVRVVTDSTASLPAELTAQFGIEVVPLHVVIDGQSFLEGVDCTPQQIAMALSAGADVSTSQPTPAQFTEVFTRLVAQGAHEIVSVHLSGKLSGTAATARAAAEQVHVPVHVVDSATAAMGLGFSALSAARSVASETPSQQRTGEQVAQVAAQTAASARAVFLVESLDHLRRGGRLGRAASAVGTMLGLRPLLTLEDGEIVVLQKVRTRHLAIDRLVELVTAEAESRSRPLIAVHHDGSGQDAADLRAKISQATRLDVVVSPLSAVLAAHVGPGLLAVVVAESL